jgi:hypothetical protein
MIRLIARFAPLAMPFALLPAPLLAQEPAPAAPESARLDLDQRLLLRCAATFALVANRQQAGEDWALSFPPMATRGREFFVRASARVIDETGTDRAGLDRLLAAEARQLVEYDQIASMMPLCLPLLEESGL